MKNPGEEMKEALKGKVQPQDAEPRKDAVFALMEALTLKPEERKMKTAKELFANLSEELENLAHRSDNGLDGILKKAKLYINKVFGHVSPYLSELKEIRFYPEIYELEGDPNAYTTYWNNGIARLSNLLDTMYEDVELGDLGLVKTNISMSIETPSEPAKRSNKVFIVHGHDEGMKFAAARTVGKFGLKDIILHERANKGKTLIEKFEHNSDVGFAVVLLSPDDMAYVKGKDANTARPRPRQNVIFELGFFAGKLGRGNVFVLYKKAPDFEMLSDYAGVVYVEFDEAGHWQLKLAQELSAVGYNIPKEAFIPED